MMRMVSGMVGGIGMLIMLYLFLRNGDKTVKIIESIGSTATKGIATLQGQYVPK